MAQIKKGSPHGLLAVQVGLVGTDGKSYGQVQQTAAGGTTSHTYLIKQPTNASLPFPDRTTIDFIGGDRWIGSFQYGITSLGNFDIEVQNVEADLIALVTGALVDQTTNSAWTIYGENIEQDALPQVCILITFRIQSRESGSDGADKFISYFVNRGWMAPKGVQNAPSFQTRGTYSFQLTPTSSDTFPHGIPFSTTQNFQDNKTPVIAIMSDNPLGLTTFIHDGTTTQFNLGYQPISTSTDSDSGANQYVVGTAATDFTSVITTSGLVSTATSADGVYSAMLYETNFIATIP
jgi:hypothetical protein